MYWKNRNISVWKRKLDPHKPPKNHGLKVRDLLNVQCPTD